MELGIMFIGLAVAFWLLTSKKFRKTNGDVVSHYVSESLNGLSDSAKMSNITNFQEFKAELKEEFNIEIAEASKQLKEFRNGIN